MQSLTLSKAAAGKRVKHALIDQAWLPVSKPPVEALNNLDEALRALTEAEQVIRSQAEHIRRLENLALTDELTGLANRRGFIMSLQRELASAKRDPHAAGILVMVDLDGFKSINDLWGHSTGDDYLQAVAHTLLGCVRGSDVVARLGGDEFVVLFPRMPEEVGLKRLEKLDKSFNSRMLQFGDRTLPLRASFGMSPYAGTDTPEEVMARADLKLYAHKASRKSRV